MFGFAEGIQSKSACAIAKHVKQTAKNGQIFQEHNLLHDLFHAWGNIPEIMEDKSCWNQKQQKWEELKLNKKLKNDK